MGRFGESNGFERNVAPASAAGVGAARLIVGLFLPFCVATNCFVHAALPAAASTATTSNFPFSAPPTAVMNGRSVHTTGDGGLYPGSDLRYARFWVGDHLVRRRSSSADRSENGLVRFRFSPNRHRDMNLLHDVPS